ncbi:uncharacterized protein LOC121781631 [Salvia splendens]|uniref:uncharacterized protein LOC121781631 n=1 Tax=Salvia splendens TaxID=180675 RepID=UPI001C27518D|nr:uncharacterized protein LOC121781631 [Salvia splendens]
MNYCQLTLLVDKFFHFTDITACNLSIARFRYVYVGFMFIIPSEIPHMCKIDLIVLTSWLGLEDLTNVSLSQIHQSLLYGFELNFCDDCNEKSTTSGKLIQHFSGPKCNVLIPLAILVFIIAGVSLLVMIIIGIAGVLALSFTPTSLLENILQYSYYDQTMLAANHIVFIAFFAGCLAVIGKLSIHNGGRTASVCPCRWQGRAPPLLRSCRWHGRALTVSVVL